MNDSHLVKNSGEASIVLFRDLIEDSKHGETVRLVEVLYRGTSVVVEVLGVDVHQVDLDREFFAVQCVL